MATATRRIPLEQYCRKLGWSIDHSYDDSIGLDFRGDDITRTRTVLVIPADDMGLLFFTYGCTIKLDGDAEKLIGIVSSSLLRRNQTSLAKWHAKDDDEGKVRLTCQYVALEAGMDADTFATICKAVINEAAAVEHILHKGGLR